MRAIRQRIAEFSSSSEEQEGLPDEARGEAVDEAVDTAAEPPRKRRKSSVATLGLFVPLIAVWGAALGALCVLVMPASIILRLAMNTGLSGLGANAAYVFAAAGALVFGGLAAFAALAFKRGKVGRSEMPSLASMAARRVQPIDPVAELGSDSLDAPIEIEPFSVSEIVGDDLDLDDGDSSSDDLLLLDEDQISEAADGPDAQTKRGPTLGELSQRGYDADPADLREDDSADDRPASLFTRDDYHDALEEVCAATPDSASIESVEDVNTKPRELDLAEFAETPGRNAVWVEEPSDEAPQNVAEPAAVEPAAQEPEPEPEPEPNPATPLAARIAPSAPTALEKLRQAPVQELSLVHMVERFAAALHDHQDTERKRPGSTRSAHSDSALAEALKALTLFTGDGFDENQHFSGENAEALRDTTRDLRDALAKLQDLRGAA